MKKTLTTLTLIGALLTLGGCFQEKTQTVDYPAPTAEELQAAFDRSIAKLNEATGSQIESFSVEWIEVPYGCYPHLDYFTQQVLWATIFQSSTKEAHTLHIDCSIAERYKQDALASQ